MIDLLNEEEICDIREDVKSVLEDNDFEVDIIYRRVLGRAFDTGTGAVTRSVSDTVLKAFMGNHSAREVANSGGILNLGDPLFMFDPRMIDGFPKSDDLILREVSNAGHLVLTQASANVTGYNTLFSTDGVQGGDLVIVQNLAQTNVDVKSVTGETTMVLKAAWTPASEPAIKFKIYRVYEIVNRIVDPIKAAYRLSAKRAGA